MSCANTHLMMAIEVHDSPHASQSVMYARTQPKPRTAAWTNKVPRDQSLGSDPSAHVHLHLLIDRLVTRSTWKLSGSTRMYHQADSVAIIHVELYESEDLFK